MAGWGPRRAQLSRTATDGCAGRRGEDVGEDGSSSIKRRSAVSTRGVVYVHSSPSAVCPHVEWAISGTLGVRANLPWTAQPAAPGQLRAECAWTAEPGARAKLVSA